MNRAVWAPKVFGAQLTGETCLIAQEVHEVLPGIVQEGSNGCLSVDYGRLTPLLVEAVRE